jgi:hypothetical protein
MKWIYSTVLSLVFTVACCGDGKGDGGDSEDAGADEERWRWAVGVWQRETFGRLSSFEVKEGGELTMWFHRCDRVPGVVDAIEYIFSLRWMADDAGVLTLGSGESSIEEVFGDLSDEGYGYLIFVRGEEHDVGIVDEGAPVYSKTGEYRRWLGPTRPCMVIGPTPMGQHCGDYTAVIDCSEL